MYIGEMKSERRDGDVFWTHPDYPESEFVELSCTGMDDVRWNTDKLIPLGESLPEGLLRECMDDEEDEVDFEFDWKYDPAEYELFAMFGIDVRDNAGAPQVLVLGRVNG